MWIQQPGIVAAHVDAAQTHIKNNYMRHPIPFEVFNEEVANLLKRKIKASLQRVDDLGIEFGYEGEVTAEDSEQILDRCAGAVRLQPGEGLLRLRGGLLPAEPEPDRGRRDR